MRGISKWKVLRATTSNPFVRDFRHLLPVPHRWFKISDWANPRLQSVRPKDRIKYWNIAPGDKIVDRLDKTKTIEEVTAVNRFSNKVFLKPVRGVSLLLWVALKVTDEPNIGTTRRRTGQFWCSAKSQKSALLSMPTLRRQITIPATRRDHGGETVSTLYPFPPFNNIHLLISITQCLCPPSENQQRPI